jgi:CAP-Gly domain-containing linker protein 3/4
MSSAGLRLGMVVATPRCDGILRFLGSTEFGSGEWAGVELAVKEGKTDGRF